MSLTLKSILLVFLGGGLGSVLRLAVLHTSRMVLPASFPWGTFAVNVIGGAAAGAIAATLMIRNIGGADGASLFLLTGLLGGFTTFSAFSLDALLLWQRGEGASALVYVLASVGLSIAAAFAGFMAVRTLA